jgi:hypothetical protein
MTTTNKYLLLKFAIKDLQFMEWKKKDVFRASFDFVFLLTAVIQ